MRRSLLATFVGGLARLKNTAKILNCETRGQFTGLFTLQCRWLGAENGSEMIAAAVSGTVACTRRQEATLTAVCCHLLIHGAPVMSRIDAGYLIPECNKCVGVCHPLLMHLWRARDTRLAEENENSIFQFPLD